MQYYISSFNKDQAEKRYGPTALPRVSLARPRGQSCSAPTSWRARLSSCGNLRWFDYIGHVQRPESCVRALAGPHDSVTHVRTSRARHACLCPTFIIAFSLLSRLTSLASVSIFADFSARAPVTWLILDSVSRSSTCN